MTISKRFSRAATLCFALAAVLAASVANAAIITVNPGNGTLQAAIDSASSGDVLELVDGVYSNSNTSYEVVSGKHLTLRARVGTVPQIAASIRLQSAHRLLLQGLSFESSYNVTDFNGGNSTLILLQNTFRKDIRCYGVKCIVIGNRFDAATTEGVESIIGGSSTTDVIFAGNEMLQRTYPYSGQSRFFVFNAATVHILGNHFNMDSGGWYSTYPVLVGRGFATILGNRFTTSVDTGGINSNIRSPSILRIENAAALIRNNVFTLESADSVSGYPISSLRAIDLTAVGGDVRIHNNVIDFRNVNLGAQVNTAEGAIAIRRHVESASGNVFRGLQHAAVNVDAGIQATIADNLCYQIAGTCPGTGAITANPLFVNATANDYHLQAGSPAIDAGPQSPLLLDIDGTRNDIGVYGGPFDLDQFDVQRGIGSTQPYVYPLFDANRSIDGNGNLQIRLIGVARNQ
jgi:hypothetical protein